MQSIQFKNPKRLWFVIGLSEKKENFTGTYSYFDDTFYGILLVGDATYWYYSGSEISNNSTDHKGIKNKILAPHFKEGDCLLDIHFDPDCDSGTMKMKRVGYIDGDEYEVVINGLNDCSKFDGSNGWCPHFVFDDISRTEQSLMIASIPPSWYGLVRDINWNQQ